MRNKIQISYNDLSRDKLLEILVNHNYSVLTEDEIKKIEKICSKCKKNKSLLEFDIQKQSKMGRDSICKECKSNAAKLRYLKKKKNNILFTDDLALKNT